MNDNKELKRRPDDVFDVLREGAKESSDSG